MPCRSPGGGGCIPACLADFQAYTQGEASGVWLGVSRPTPRGVEGLGGLEAYTWRGATGPHLGGGLYPNMH